MQIFLPQRFQQTLIPAGTLDIRQLQLPGMNKA
jgi:hypothetical protein